MFLPRTQVEASGHILLVTVIMTLFLATVAIIIGELSGREGLSYIGIVMFLLGLLMALFASIIGIQAKGRARGIFG